MDTIIAHFFGKLGDIFQHVGSFFAALALVVVNYFSGHAFVCFLVLAVTIMDALWGVAVSIRRNNFVLSELGRQTVAKFAVYGCAMFVFVGLDHFTESQMSASIVGAIIVLVEFWSSAGSMSILFPDMPFLRLMRKALKGEISRKLQCDESEVEEILNENSNSNNNTPTYGTC